MKTFGSWVIFIFIGRMAFGANIKTTYEYEAPNSRVAHTIFTCDGKQLNFPERTSVVSTISNEKKLIWAVNFHETSNYNDVDLALCCDHSPQLLLAISNQIVPMLTDKGLIPKCPWDNQQLVISKIVGNDLSGRFFGATHLPLRTFIQNFTVQVQVTPESARFIMLKAVTEKK